MDVVHRDLAKASDTAAMPKSVGYGLGKWQFWYWKYTLTNWSKGHKEGHDIWSM